MPEEASSLKSEMNGLKAEMNGLKSEMSGLKAEFAGLRSEFNALTRTVARIGWGLAGAVFLSSIAVITTMIATQP